MGVTLVLDALLRTAGRVGRWLRALPWQAWAVLLALALSVALLFAHRQAVEHADAAGYARALREAAAVAPARRDTVRIAVAHTDTVVRTYTRQVGHVQEIANRVHDTVRVAFPVVDTLVREVDALADSLPKLVAAISTERTAHEALALSLSAITVAQRDTIRSLNTRPRRRTVALLVTLAAAAGYLGGAR